MYCNVTVPLSYGDDGCHLIVTEMNFMGDHFEVETGYVVEGYDFSEVYNAHHLEIQKALMKWWREGDDEV